MPLVGTDGRRPAEGGDGVEGVRQGVARHDRPRGEHPVATGMPQGGAAHERLAQRALLGCIPALQSAAEVHQRRPGVHRLRDGHHRGTGLARACHPAAHCG